jgi:hypothetical protein
MVDQSVCLDAAQARRREGTAWGQCYDFKIFIYILKFIYFMPKNDHHNAFQDFFLPETV